MITPEDFVAARDITFGEIVMEVDRALGLLPNDALLVVGSLVEDLGTTKSDLDLLLLTARGEGSTRESDECAIVVGRCVVDVRLVRIAELDRLVERLNDWARLAWDPTHVARFSREERVLLHRLLHARCLSAIDPRASGSFKLPMKEDLARLGLHVARHASRTVQVDMVGHRDGCDFPSLVFAAQDLLGYAIDGLLVGHGFTNPLPKWRTRLLDFLPLDWESSMMLRPSQMTAREVFWNLHRAPAVAAKEESLQHALRISAFSRAVFAWAEGCVLHRAAPRANGHHWPLFEASPRETILPCLDIDVDFMFVDEGVMVGRLNDFGATVDISSEQFNVALLLDGSTTFREVEAASYGMADGSTSATHSLLARIAAANLYAK